LARETKIPPIPRRAEIRGWGKGKEIRLAEYITKKWAGRK
jgi:hypothetical protein